MEIRRPLIAQDFFSFSLTVGVDATPLNAASQQSGISSLIDSFIISVPLAAAHAVVLGSQNVQAGPPVVGLEIRPGVPIQLSISNERQLYELQDPLVGMSCRLPEKIPFTVWDPSNIFLIAVAPVSIGVIMFRASYV